MATTRKNKSWKLYTTQDNETQRTSDTNTHRKAQITAPNLLQGKKWMAPNTTIPNMQNKKLHRTQMHTLQLNSTDTSK